MVLNGLNGSECTKSTRFARRYFVCEAADFEDFAEKACKIFRNKISPTTAVQLVLQHRAEVLKLEPVKVFVFVDEFRKLFDVCNENQGDYRGQDMAVLRSIGILLSQPKKHTVVISTLESTALVKDGSFFFLV